MREGSAFDWGDYNSYANTLKSMPLDPDEGSWWVLGVAVNKCLRNRISQTRVSVKGTDWPFLVGLARNIGAKVNTILGKVYDIWANDRDNTSSMI